MSFISNPGTSITLPLAVSDGGTGQTSFTDGQLLIGNSIGNTLSKATLTGTTNQVNITNGNGSITLSLPQNIDSGASPTFSGLTINGSIDGSGHTAFGASVAVSTAAIENIGETYTITDNAARFGINLSATGEKTSSSYGNQLFGLRCFASTGSNNTQAWTASTNGGGVVGIQSWLSIGGTGTLTLCSNFRSRTGVFGAITTRHGLSIDNPGGSVALTNNYGIFIENQTYGTNDYGIYVAGADTYALWIDAGISRFDGNVGIGTEGINPLSKLHIEGASGWIIQDEQDIDPSTTELDANDSIAIYNKNNKFVIAYNNAGTITYITIPLDGASTAWSHSTVAP